jgi:hypothetical protein
MKRTEVLKGVRMLRFRDVFGRWEKGRLSELEAAELLGVLGGTCSRAARCAHAVAKAEAARSGRLYRERYQGFTGANGYASRSSG